MLDLAIYNALVVDGTGRAPFFADLGIRGDRIEVVGDVRGPSKAHVDVCGRVVAPGFIDIHGHSDYSIVADPFARSKVFQGVTTEVIGNCGYHAAPVVGSLAQQRRTEYEGSHGMCVSWGTTAEYFDVLREVGMSLNVVKQTGYNTIRSALAGDHARKLSPSELSSIAKAIQQDISDGSVGLSYGVAYAPACFASTDELIHAGSAAADAGGWLSFHIRDEGNQLLESLEEALLISSVSGAPAHIGHLKTFLEHNWHKLDSALALLRDYKSRGNKLTVDRYPHLAMNTQLKFILPRWCLEGGTAAMQERLAKTEIRDRVREEMKQDSSGSKRVMISFASRPENKWVEGKFLDELSFEAAVDLVASLLASEGESAFATYFGMSDPNLERILGEDYAIPASDASVQAIHRQAGGGSPHPRCFDTFPLFLSEWVLGRKVMTLEQGIHRITGLPAATLGLQNRGRVAEGDFADLVVLAPEHMRRDVSYSNPTRAPSGVLMVVVNGEVVVGENGHTRLRPGRILRPRSAS